MPPPTERALEKLKRRETRYNVAAILLADVSPRDLDGARWRLLVTDGSTVDELEAQLSGSEGGTPGMLIEDAVVEQAVERRAGNFAVESRLADMVAASPLTLRGDDLQK